MKSLITLMALISSVFVVPLAAQIPLELTPEEQALLESAYLGKLDEVEFRCYLADVALSFGEGDDARNALPGIIELFTKLDAEIDAEDSK